MISNHLPPIQAFILDLDGVLWRDDQPIGNLPEIFNTIARKGMKFILATNNSTKSVSQYQNKLRTFGVEIEPWQIVNSGIAVAYLLMKRFPSGGSIFILGEPGLINTLEEFGFTHSDENPIAVVAGMDRQVNYSKLTKASTFIRNGVPFFGTNDDHTFPIPGGLIPGAGAILAALETASDVKPIIAGKPFPAMMEISLERLKTPLAQTLVVGDRLETDILGGINVGCPTALVLSGVTDLERLQKSDIHPDFVAPDLESLIGLC
jgi:4-nitrophenyl phosphatase